MANVKITELPELAEAPASGDFFEVVDVSTGLNKKVQAQYVGSGGGGAVDSVNGQTGVVSIDLESVLTEGGTATDLFILLDSASSDVTNEITSDYIVLSDSVTLDIGTITQSGVQLQDSTQSLSFSKDKIQRVKGGFTTDLEFTDPTANNSVVVQDGSGTLAFLSDITGVSDGDKGDITVSSSGTVWTIDNGVVDNAKVASGIDAVKLADGSVSNTELQYINSLTSNAQTQLDSKQLKPSFMVLSSPYVGGAGTALQKLFNVGSGSGGAFNADANSTYEFKCEFALTALSSSSGTFSFGFLGTAGISSVLYEAVATKASTTLAGVANATITTGAVATAVVIVAATANTVGKACITGVIRTSTAGTIIPSFAVSVSTTPQVEANSMFIISKLGSDTVTNSSDIS